MLALATLSGGLLGLIDLRLAYVFSLLSASVMALLVWRFTEPKHADETIALPQSFVTVVSSCIGRLRDPLLGWIFLVVIMLYSMAHIVYEFYQPYITLLQLPLLEASTHAPRRAWRQGEHFLAVQAWPGRPARGCQLYPVGPGRGDGDCVEPGSACAGEPA
jgi:hypothetical protein